MALHGEYQRNERWLMEAIGFGCLTWSKTGKLDDAKTFQRRVTSHSEGCACIPQGLER